MKKIVTIFSSIILLSCNKIIDDTPRCEDRDVLETVKNLSKLKNYFSSDLNVKVFEEYTGKKIYQLKEGTQEYKKLDELYRNINSYLDQYIFEKNENTIPSDILPIIRDVVSHYDIPSRLYDIPEVKNIRLVSVDKETKSCSCEADLKYTDKNNQEKSKSIFYSAQKNTDGETYVEVLK